MKNSANSERERAKEKVSDRDSERESKRERVEGWGKGMIKGTA